MNLSPGALGARGGEVVGFPAMSTLPTADTQRLVARTQALPSGVADDLDRKSVV